MEHSVLPSGRFRCGRSRGIPALVGVLLLILTSAAGQANVNKEKPDTNPHGNPTLCSSCHTSTTGGWGSLRFNGNVSQLCQSCHDGRRAAREVHPVNMAPSTAAARRIPPDFPLKDGMLTCLSCHDVTPHCKTRQQAATPKRGLLRGPDVSHPLELCFCCHERQSLRPFNAHDQFEGGQPKTDTCVWCHAGAPDAASRSEDDASHALRSTSFGVCANCHPVAKGHPNDGPHMGALPSAEMMSYMSAYEIQPWMSLPLKQLVEYVRAAKRDPRSIPLDENGRVTCYSCHNPHEKGLLPNWNPRSLGAESKRAVNHRLRARDGQLCIACHQK